MASILESIVQLFNEYSRKIATGVNIVLIVFMSLTVANAVLFTLEVADPASIDISNPAASRPVSSNPGYKVSDLELFGKLEESKVSQQVIDAPETKLNLELQGVFLSDNENLSTAIIGERNKAGELYEIGDRLPGNATLASVFVDHVLLRRGARMEKLMFSDSKFRISQQPDNRQARTTPGEPAIPGTNTTRSDLERIRDRIRNRNEMEPGINNGIDTGRTSNRQSFDEYTRRLKNDPAGTLGEAGISAVSEGDSKGYRVDDSAQGAIRQAGLQPGDVIVSVNGRPVGNIANDSALIDQVRSSSRVRVEVQRGGRRFFLTVPVPK